MKKIKTLVTVVTIVTVVIGGLYMAGYDIAIPTENGKSIVSNGIDTIEADNYIYTPVFHDIELSIHRDNAYHSLPPFYICNVRTYDTIDRYTVRKIQQALKYHMSYLKYYIIYSILMLALIIVVNKQYKSN